MIPLKDPTSDMAVICRKGCKSVRHYREQKERKKAHETVNQLAGTQMGNILGVKQKSDREDVEEEGATSGVDYKKSTQFAEHMNEKSEAASEFAKTHTMRQQREFLPVYAIKEEVSRFLYE